MSAADFLDQLGARVEISGSTGERRARPVLDAGRRGLDFFRRFGPPHARYTGTDHDFTRDFVCRYEAHADLVFGALREDRERFASVDSGLFDSATSLRNQGEAVFGSWQGGAADGIKARLSRMLGTVDSLRAEFTLLSEVVGVVVDAADRAVYEKAAATRRLYADQIDGRGADDVKFLVDFHARVTTGDDVDDDEVARAVSLCGIKPLPSVSRNKHTLLVEAASAVDGWLRQEFAPAYEAKVAAFHDICTDADTKLAGCWRRLTDALGTLHMDHADPAVPPAPRTELPAAPATRPETPEVAPSVQASGAPASGAGGGGAGGAGGGAGSVGGGTEPAPPPLPPGSAVGAVDGEQEPARKQAPGTGRVAATAGGGGMGAAAGLLGGLPMLGGVLGGTDHDRRALDLPLAGVEFATTPQSVPVVGGQDDPATYNDAAQAEADVERETYEQLPVAGEDDLW